MNGGKLSVFSTLLSGRHKGKSAEELERYYWEMLRR